MGKSEKRCLNCNNKVAKHYCDNCGQSIHTNRINTKHLIEELQYGIFHINKGVLYTAKELLLNPGITIKNYLIGKRIKYTKPFTFLLICGTIYSIIFHLFHFFPLEDMNSNNNMILEYLPIYNWYSNYYSLSSLFLIPFYSLSTYLFFYKKGYNYIEHLVIFSYINGTKILLILVFYPLIYLSKSYGIYQAVHILAEIYVIYALTQFFKSNSSLKAMGKVVLCLLLTFIVIVIIATIAYEVLHSYNIKL